MYGHCYLHYDGKRYLVELLCLAGMTSHVRVTVLTGIAVRQNKICMFTVTC